MRAEIRWGLIKPASGAQTHQLPFPVNRLGSSTRECLTPTGSQASVSTSHLTGNAGSQVPPLEGFSQAGKSRDLTPENSKSLQAYPQLFRLKILQITGSKVKVLFPRFCSNFKCSHEVMKIRGSTVSELNCLSEKQTQIYFSDFRSQGLTNTLNPPSLSHHVLSQALSFFAIK